jgi:hypothetical protein
MGAFSAMAQNNYGIKILGYVAIAFSLLFVVQFIQLLQKTSNQKIIALVELGSLVILSIILAMRVYYIRFQFVEVVFGIAGLLMISVYANKLLHSWKILNNGSRVLAILMVLYHGSIILYIASMISVPFIPQLAEPMGGIAFALLLAFLFFSFRKKDIMLEGEKVTGLSYVSKFKDRSIVLLTLFVLFTAYMGLTKIDILPKMYSDEYPQAYFELVKQAEAGKEKPVNGKYKHEEFKEMYDRFVSRNSVLDQK